MIFCPYCGNICSFCFTHPFAEFYFLHGNDPYICIWVPACCKLLFFYVKLFKYCIGRKLFSFYNYSLNRSGSIIFRDGKAVIKFSKHYIAAGMFKKICRNSDRLARKILGIKESCSFLRPQHICSPMLKSVCEEVYEKADKEIAQSITRTRTESNYTQYLFLDYMYLTGRIIDERIEKKHFSTAITSARKLRNFIINPTRKLVCINDVKLSMNRYMRLRSAVHEAFGIHGYGSVMGRRGHRPLRITLPWA